MPKLTTKLNPIALLGAVVGIAALISLPGFDPGWLLYKANRIVLGEAYAAFELSTRWAAFLLSIWVLAGLVGLLPVRGRAWLLSVLAAAALIVAILFVSQGTAQLLAAESGAGLGVARVSPQGGVWLSLLAYYIVIFAALAEAQGGRVQKLLLVAPGLLLAALLIGFGALNDLGLARELANQGRDFNAELLRHLGLSGTSVLLASVIGIPAAIWAARRDRVAAVVLPTAGLLQTFPSLALFGLMLAPLAQLGQNMSQGSAVVFILAGAVLAGLFGTLIWWLGERLKGLLRHVLALLTLAVALLPLALLIVIVAVVLNELIVALLSFDLSSFRLQLGWNLPLADLGVRGIGTAPALIALTLYAFLPIIRNTYTGICEVPKDAVEAGRGMGMSSMQILRRVELPLALPLMVEGLRASAVLTIGITTVAFLIGAGGLGTFIQRGIGQRVPDLILLGALPIILLALLADGLLRALGLLLTPKGIRS